MTQLRPEVAVGPAPTPTPRRAGHPEAADPEGDRRPSRASAARHWAGQNRRWLVVLAVLGLLGQMAVAMVTAARAQSPTNDEPVYVGAAVVYLQQHSLRYNPEHPPLGKLIAASGLVFAHATLSPKAKGNQGHLGKRLLYDEGNDAQYLLLLARLPMIVLALLFGLVVFAFARDLVGAGGALIALALYAFSPDVIAHGSLATLDVPFAGFLLTALWLLWRARRQPTRYLPWAGVALGAALATKMTTLPAVPILMLLVVLSVWHAGRARPTRPTPVRLLLTGAAAAVGVAAITIAVVWLTYLVVDPTLRWTTPPNVPSIGGLRGTIVEWLPFPRPFRDGMRIQLGFEDKTFGGYLFGEYYRGARWYYLPAALLVKTPLGMLALWLAGAATLLAVPRLRAVASYLLVPAAALLAVAMTGSRDLGVRYVVFLPMLLAVAAAGLVAWRRRWVTAAVCALAAFAAVSSVRTYPLYLPYANEAFGGPAHTWRHLHDSNVDWGQDLARLAEHLGTRYPGEPVWLVYRGSGKPSYYGIVSADPRTVPADQVHGLLVVSVSQQVNAPAQMVALINSSTKIDEVGHSIMIYRR